MEELEESLNVDLNNKEIGLRLKVSSKTSLIAVFVAVILLGSFFCSVNAQNSTGLSIGDVFSYWRYNVWESNDPNVTTASDQYITSNNTLITVKVNSVSSPIVNVDIISEYQDGTEKTLSRSPNIVTGENDEVPAILSAVQGVFENIRLIQTQQNQINYTESRTYESSTRNVNVFSVSLGPWIVLGSNQYFSIQDYEICYDLETGMFLELKTKQYTYDSTNTNLNYTIQQFITIQDTNVWVIPEFPSVLMVSFAMIAILLVTFSFKLLKNQKVTCINKIQ